ncbi:MAG: TetR family transcriptional regulator [Anaerolineaceae bacterium]|nr:TetR family transcriptional regulator [Anaerolineaceae bacterium]
MEATTTRKEDRRKERTRQLLRDALLELIPEKGYEAITLQDITDRANVARPTFYLHFKDKQDLLFSSLREIYDDLAKRQHINCEPDELLLKSMETGGDSDFEHVAENSAFYQTMLSEKGSIAFVLMVLEYLSTIMGTEFVNKLSEKTNPRVPPDFVSSFIAGAEIGVVNWWLKHNHMRYSPQQISRMMNHVALLGTGWALNLDIHPPAEEPDFSEYDHG